jgi:hypothetical protein
MLKQQAADFKLVFILMEIINFEATWILNAIKIECCIFEVQFYHAYLIYKNYIIILKYLSVYIS